MSFDELNECFEKIRNNIDMFIKQSELNSEIIQNYLRVTQQVIETLKEQMKQIEELENSEAVKIWKKHLKENKNIKLLDIANEIEEKLNEYDMELKKFIKEKEKYKEMILKANKKG